MALETVIFDNTVFNYFLKIHSVNLERIVRSIIRDKVLIPSQIAVEMEQLGKKKLDFQSKINRWLDMSYRKSFYHYCDTFDSIVFDNVKKELDIGEAGAIAQAEKMRVSWFISDDIKNISFIEKNYSHIKQHSIFFLIALADVLELLPDYKSVLKDFLRVRGYKNFTSSKKRQLKALIRSDYIDALKLEGLNYNKKIVSQKTSLDRILQNKVL